MTMDPSEDPIDYCTTLGSGFRQTSHCNHDNEFVTCAFDAMPVLPFFEAQEKIVTAPNKKCAV